MVIKAGLMPIVARGPQHAAARVSRRRSNQKPAGRDLFGRAMVWRTQSAARLRDMGPARPLVAAQPLRVCGCNCSDSARRG
eukprot:4633133-Lingulodinium_polyedra.AAC.1